MRHTGKNPAAHASAAAPSQAADHRRSASGAQGAEHHAPGTPPTHRDVAAQSPQLARLSNLQQTVRPALLSPNAPTPAQLSGGSSQANKELVKAMGKAAERVDKLPNAKPHTATGTGGGGGGTDHQARNASVINKAKRDTMKAHNDPTMFSSSRMRSDDRAKEKDKEAAEKRREKSSQQSHSLSDFEKAMEQARTTYAGNQEAFDEYLERKEFEFSTDELDELYAVVLQSVDE